jgi:hypothetical protein
MIRKFCLIFVLLASLFSFESIAAPAPTAHVTTEVVITIERQDRQEENIVLPIRRVSIPEHFFATPKTLKGNHHLQELLIACLQHHSSLSC